MTHHFNDTPPADVEAIAEVLAAHQWAMWACSCGYDANEHPRGPQTEDEHLARALLASPALAALRAHERAEAWDEGYEQASRDCGPFQYVETANPHRDRADRQDNNG